LRVRPAGPARGPGAGGFARLDEVIAAWFGIVRDHRETDQHALADAARVLDVDVRGAQAARIALSEPAL
jgi:hypothetical protein